MTSMSLRVGDSGFYDSSDHSLQRQSPLAGSTVAHSVSGDAGLLPLNVSPVPPPDRWTPLSDDTSGDDQQVQVDRHLPEYCTCHECTEPHSPSVVRSGVMCTL